MSHSSDSPVAIASEQGNDGRLVGLAFDRVRLAVVPETNTRLVAVAGSNNTLRAVEHTIRQAGETNACARLVTERAFGRPTHWQLPW